MFAKSVAVTSRNLRFFSPYGTMNFSSPTSLYRTGLWLWLGILSLACQALAADNPVALGSSVLARSSVFGVPQSGIITPGRQWGGSQILPPASAPSGTAVNTLSGSLRAPAFLQQGPVASFNPASPFPKLDGPRSPSASSFSEGDVPLSITWADGGTLGVSIPTGIFQVTLERATATGWKPADILHLDGTAQITSFAMPAGAALENLRVVGATTRKFSPAQCQGEDAFAWQDDQLASINPGVSFNTLSGTSGLVSNVVNTTTTTTTTAPEAVESDIWKLIGNRLFFFNQFRGMQVFDLTNPAHPVKTGAVRMAAVGEQFYALDSTGSGLALLTRNNTRNTALGISTLQLMKVSAAGRPDLVRQVPLNGSIADSRMLGSRVYILLSRWDGGAKVSLVGYDLADPANPVSLGAVDLPGGYYLALQASGPWLMVSSSANGGWNSASPSEANCLSVIDASGNGALRLVKTVNTTGYLADQFKMTIDGDTLTAVSLAWAPAGGTFIRQTWVETFSLSALGKAPLGRLKIDKADGEQLYATRFDAGRLYVVTFRQVDPLFIIDLKDPAHPALEGELVTPGYSSYIEPQGDRLLAVGVEDWRVCVSWFDVSKANAPKLLSRVYPGNADASHYTWSEANYDHKAVNWVKSEGRIFLPFQQWDGGYYSATQVVNLAEDKLTLGPAIRNRGSARRGDVINDSIVSISGQQMVVTTNPESGDPKELTRLELSWPVDRVVALDNYLVQAEDGTTYGWWGFSQTSTTEAVLRLSDKQDLDTVLDSVSLGNGHIVGLARHGSRVIVGQMVPPDDQHVNGLLRTWTIGVDAAGKLQRLSDAATSISADLFSNLNGSSAESTWVAEDILAWQVPAQARFFWWGGPILLTVSPTLTLTTGTITKGAVVNSTTQTITTPLLYPVKQGELCAMVFPVRVGADDSLKAGGGVEVHLPEGGRPGTVGKPFTDRGFLFFSAERNWYNYGWNTLYTTNSIVIGDQAGLFYGQGSSASLHVLDFRHGLNPVVRDPVSLAGSLLGVSGVDKDGAFLLTGRNDGYGVDGYSSARLVSLAYDGVRAHKIDSLEMHRWNTACSEDATAYFSMGGQIYPSPVPPVVKSLSINADTGMIEPGATWDLDQAAYALNVVNHHLLASTWGSLEVAAIGLDRSLTTEARFDLPDNLWFNVERAALDPDASGLWLPAGDYGAEHFDFGK